MNAIGLNWSCKKLSNLAVEECDRAIKTFSSIGLIFHQGKLGILEVGNDTSPQDNSSDEIRTIPFTASGIHLVKDYDANKWSEQPDLIVQEFLEVLSQT